jgi:hypothetical protein
MAGHHTFDAVELEHFAVLIDDLRRKANIRNDHPAVIANVLPDGNLDRAFGAADHDPAT